MDPAITTQLETIRAAFVDGASPETVCAGAIACRALAGVLEARPGQPLAPTPATARSTLAGLLPQLGSLDIDQILEFVIAKLRAMLPAGTSPPVPRSYRLPTLRLGGGV
jgi:hypothetical protein